MTHSWKIYSRKAARRLPLWAKVLMVATAGILVTGAVVGPAVYFGLKGKLFFLHWPYLGICDISVNTVDTDTFISETPKISKYSC